jgi:hypothetical protein
MRDGVRDVASTATASTSCIFRPASEKSMQVPCGTHAGRCSCGILLALGEGPRHPLVRVRGLAVLLDLEGAFRKQAFHGVSQRLLALAPSLLATDVFGEDLRGIVVAGRR